jgi:hypothetical protein
VLDSSVAGLFLFGMLGPRDGPLAATMAAVEEELWCGGGVGGLARYAGDDYHQVCAPGPGLPGNPWMICTLWLADWYLERGRWPEDLERAQDLLLWVAERALPSGVLAEQVHPRTSAPLSVSPLTWSHAEFVGTVHRFLDCLKRLQVGKPGTAFSGARHSVPEATEEGSRGPCETGKNGADGQHLVADDQGEAEPSPPKEVSPAKNGEVAPEPNVVPGSAGGTPALPGVAATAGRPRCTALAPPGSPASLDVDRGTDRVTVVEAAGGAHRDADAAVAVVRTEIAIAVDGASGPVVVARVVEATILGPLPAPPLVPDPERAARRPRAHPALQPLAVVEIPTGRRDPQHVRQPPPVILVQPLLAETDHDAVLWPQRMRCGWGETMGGEPHRQRQNGYSGEKPALEFQVSEPRPSR